MKVEPLTDAVTWVPVLPAAGTYQVYVKWTADEIRVTDAVYNQAVQDVRAHLQVRLDDLEGEVYADG